MTDPEIKLREVYRTAIETRNFEISLFWQRSNYFLILNAAVAAGFFSLKGYQGLLLGSLGFFIALLWVGVTLGGKFWQSRWEYEVAKLEKTVYPNDRLFSAEWPEIHAAVSASLAFGNHGCVRSFFDRLVLRKPSVSFMMMLLSLLFVAFWLLALAGLAWKACAE